jgi:hypothetical protein
VHYHSFHGVDGTVLLWRGVYVASIEIDAICVYAEVPAGDAVWIEDGENVENEVVPEYSADFAVFCELVDDSCHHVRPRNFSGMHSRSNYNAFLIALKLSRS